MIAGRFIVLLVLLCLLLSASVVVTGNAREEGSDCLYRTGQLTFLHAQGDRVEGYVLSDMHAGLDHPAPSIGTPEAPTGLHVEEGKGQLVLNWTAPIFAGSSPIEGYNIYRGTAPGSLSLLISVTTVTYVDGNVLSGQSYFYSVSAVNAAGEGERSGEVEAEVQGEDENPPPLIPLDQWPTQLAVGLAVLAIVAIGALAVNEVRKRAARKAEGYVDCPRCGAEVPPKAHNCPKCNAHIRGPR